MKFVHHPTRPTEHYDERVRAIDEKLCEFIAKRKTLSHGNPGYPPMAQVETWAVQFGLYENYLHSLFHVLLNEDIHRPRVEPAEYLGMIPVLRLAETEGRVFLVSYLRQYQNATVLHLEIEDFVEEPSTEKPHGHVEWSVSISPEYESYWAGGGGSHNRWSHKFVVTPSLPDDVSHICFAFTWRQRGTVEAQTDAYSGTVTL
ncbi:MAG: hypothetical protein OWT28_03665 [Firmicutes bacterium]|nr:hypothetical protein [Bacillota bacterium]